MMRDMQKIVEGAEKKRKRKNRRLKLFLEKLFAGILRK